MSQDLIDRVIRDFVSPLSDEDIFKARVLGHVPDGVLEEARAKADEHLKPLYDLVDQSDDLVDIIDTIINRSMDSQAINWITRRFAADDELLEAMFKSESFNHWIRREKIMIP